MAASSGAISDDEAACLFAPLELFDTLVLAVSGGPDSMALMGLAAAWSAARGTSTPRLIVATVDHGLRPEAAAEALFVRDRARASGLEHVIMHWEGEKPTHGIPAAARSARYALLEQIAAKHARDGGRAGIVTAHTQDDQAETLLMRLKRGSGVDGLSAMAPERPLGRGSAIALLRPLLEIPKARLLATLNGRGWSWVEDPTNQNLAFERPRLRRLMSDLTQHGFEAAALATSARRLRSAGEALDYAQDHFVATLDLTLNGDVFAALDRGAFQAGPSLLRERAMETLIGRFGGATPAPERSEVEALVRRLAGAGDMTATLGGAVVAAGPRRLKVWREAGRIDPKPLQLAPGIGKLWDNRFWVQAEGAEGTVEVRSLSLEATARLPDALRPGHVPSRAVAALPGFFLEGALISVPALSYHVRGGPCCTARASRRE